MTDQTPVDTSAAHENIASALAAAQGKMDKARKSANNPHFKTKYADLASVMDACLPALSAVGIAVTQPPGEDDAGRYVETVLTHGPSGERMTCRVPLIVQKNDMQGFGSAVTYARRYGLMAMAGIAPEDDDGNAAAKAAPPQRHSSTEALRDAWKDGVLDSLPEDATPQQKARGFADALIDGFSRTKSVRGLEGGWAKRQDIIDQIEAADLMAHADVCDAFETRMRALTEPSE